jgi:hypothetical protein
MEALVELLAFSAGGVVALAASRFVLGRILDLTFRSPGPAPPPVRKPAGA